MDKFGGLQARAGIPKPFDGAVVSYFLLQRAADGIQHADFRNLSKESFALYKKSYGREGEVSVERDLFFFRCKFKATMKTSVTYLVEAVLEKSDHDGKFFDTIVFAACKCPAGSAPATCKHVAAVFYGLEDFSRTGNFAGSTCSTSQLQKWNAPPKQRLVKDMSFQQLTHSALRAKKRSASERHEHDPRPPAKRTPCPDLEKTNLCQLLLKASAPQQKKPCFLHLLLSPEELRNGAFPDSAPSVSLAKTLKVVLPDITALATDFRNSLDLNTPLSKEDLAEVCDRFPRSLK